MTNYISILEELTGHKFQNLKRAKAALTHASARQNFLSKLKKKSASLEKEERNIVHYERLEFLGDRVLGLLISEMLCELFEEASEGELSVRLNSLVNAQTCAEIAVESGLSSIIIMGTDMKFLEERRLYNIYADVVEALIAVLYLEGGLDVVRPFIRKFWEKRAKSCLAGQRDAKTTLQEWAHQQNRSQPAYRLIKREGPDHEPLFEVEVKVTGYKVAFGRGASKRSAEHAAAQALLNQEKIARS